MTAVFDHVRALRESSDYFDLARQVAVGEDVDPEAVDRALMRENKTPETFEALVRQCQSREHQRQLAAEVDDLIAEQQRLRAEVNLANSELEAAVQRHQQQCHPLQFRIQQLDQEI